MRQEGFSLQFTQDSAPCIANSLENVLNESEGAALTMSATLEQETELIEGATPDVVEEEESGHIAHSKSAEAKGLPGKMRRPIKVTVMGAGSGFTPDPCPGRAANPRRAGRNDCAGGH